MVKIAEPDFSLPESDQEQEVCKKNVVMDTTANSEMEDVNLSTLVDSNQDSEFDKNSQFFCHDCSTNMTSLEFFEKHMEQHHMNQDGRDQDSEIDRSNQFFCHECSTNLTCFESFEQHMEQHFMEIENDSCASTSKTILTDGKTKGGASDESGYLSDDGETIDKNQLKPIVKKMRTENKIKDSKIEEEASDDNEADEKKQDNNYSKKSCPICQLSSTRLDHLLVHVGSQHFKQYILDSYVDQDPETCKKCPRSFGQQRLLISHIILKHRALKYIVPKHIYQKLESFRTPHYTRAEKKRHCISKMSILEPSTRDLVSKPSGSVLSTTYQCTLCNTTQLGYAEFLLHVGKEHYMAVLNRVHKFTSSRCDTCIEMVSEDDKLIGHLIIEHGALKEELKREFLTSQQKSKSSRSS